MQYKLEAADRGGSRRIEADGGAHAMENRARGHLAYLSLAGLFALFAGLFALAKVFANKKANGRRGERG